MFFHNGLFHLYLDLLVNIAHIFIFHCLSGQLKTACILQHSRRIFLRFAAYIAVQKIFPLQSCNMQAVCKQFFHLCLQYR